MPCLPGVSSTTSSIFWRSSLPICSTCPNHLGIPLFFFFHYGYIGLAFFLDLLLYFYSTYTSIQLNLLSCWYQNSIVQPWILPSFNVSNYQSFSVYSILHLCQFIPKVVDAFRAGDRGGRGTIPASQLRNLLQNWGEGLSAREVCTIWLCKATQALTMQPWSYKYPIYCNLIVH